MNRLIRACGVLLVWAGAAAAQPSEFRDARLARIDDPITIRFAAADPAALKQAIATAAAARNWQIATESPGVVSVVELTRNIANKHSMRISLAYERQSYTIRYVESVNLLYNENAANMRGYRHRAIHKNYNLWVRELADSINAAAGVSVVAAGATRRGTADPGSLPATLPERVEIVAPGPDAAPQAAAYSGQWAGLWGTTLQHILVVERVEGRNASLLYCWGSSPTVKQPGCSHEIAAVDEEGVLRGKWKNGAQVSYRANADGRSLRGEYVRNGRVTVGTFEKVPR